MQAKEEARKKDEAASKDREAALLRAQDDAKRRQEEAAHNDAVSAFQTLLAELVKDPYAQWKVAHHQHNMQLPTMLPEGVAVNARAVCALLQYLHTCITHQVSGSVQVHCVHDCPSSMMQVFAL